MFSVNPLSSEGNVRACVFFFFFFLKENKYKPIDCKHYYESKWFVS